MSNPTGLPYTPVVAAGGWLVVSGQVGLGSEGIIHGGFEAEMAQVLVNLRTRLAEHGAGLADVVKTTVFLRHMATDYARMNELYAEAFPEPRPARSAIGVAELPMGTLVEIEAWAYLGDR